MELYFLLAGLGMICGFFSGMLGIGGGIIMAPLLLYVPHWFGFAPFSMRVVAGLTIVQALVACLSGALTHKKFHYVSGSLAVWMGTTIFIAALVGGAGAGLVAESVLLLVFGVLALIAGALILIPVKGDSEEPDLGDFSFSRPRALLVAGSVGLLGGLVGQGGSFILIPLMTVYMRVPTRIAVGSNLAIVFLSSLAAFAGKAVTGQIAWLLALPIIASVVPATCLGSLVSRKVPVARLKMILAGCILLAAARVGFSAAGY